MGSSCLQGLCHSDGYTVAQCRGVVRRILNPPPLWALGVIPEAPPWWCWSGGMVIPESLLHGAGPGGLSLSCPYYAAGTDRVVLLSLPTPLTLCLPRIQSPAWCTLALGKRLSVLPYVVTAGLSVQPHFRENLLLLQTESLCPGREPIGWWMQAGFVFSHSYSRETAALSSCRLSLWPSHCTWGWQTQAGSVLSHSPPGRELLSPAVDSASDLPRTQA